VVCVQYDCPGLHVVICADSPALLMSQPITITAMMMPSAMLPALVPFRGGGA
jgi:hypothetical protein